MKRRAFVFLSALLPWVAFGAFTHRDNPSHWTLPQWQTWRDAQIRTILTPSFKTPSGERVLQRGEVILHSTQAYNFLQPLLTNPSFLADPARAKALGNFVRFVKAQHWMAIQDANGTQTHALGMDVTDAQYWETAGAPKEFPDLLQDQDFLQKLLDPSTYKEAVDMIQAHNRTLPEDQKWIVLPFRAQFILSADEQTYGRLLVMVPNVKLPDGKLLDRWFGFAMVTPDQGENAPAVRSVSLVSTIRDPQKPDSCRGYLFDFMREPNSLTGKISLIPTYKVNPDPSRNCYDCHKSAVLPIFPKAQYKFDSSGKLVEDPAARRAVPTLLNTLIRKYGTTTYSHLDSQAYGPSMGQANLARTDEFIAKATQDAPIPRTSFAKIKANMNCASCHNEFAKINYLVGVKSDRDVKAFESKQGLVQTMIEQGTMPPGNKLTQPERHALWNCVMKEYFDPSTQSGTFVDWLKGKS